MSLRRLLVLLIGLVTVTGFASGCIVDDDEDGGDGTDVNVDDGDDGDTTVVEEDDDPDNVFVDSDGNDGGS